MFSKYHNTTEIFLDNKLIVKENLLIEPATINLNALGQLEGFTHQASLIYLHASVEIKPLIDFLTEYLTDQAGIIFGITASSANGLIVRILGNKAEQLHSCLKTIATLLPQKIKRKSVADAV